MSASGILLVAHGSRGNQGMELLERIAGDMRRRFPSHPVSLAMVGDSSIRGSIHRQAALGVRRILVVPVFISHGVHTMRDIPEELGLAPKSGGGTVKVDGAEVYIDYRPPLGEDERLIDLLEALVREGLDG
ncbi:MAG: CbiX/SirB N-terminal domain-containing protein [Methanomassiliicoccales archaeon]